MHVSSTIRWEDHENNFSFTKLLGELEHICPLSSRQEDDTITKQLPKEILAIIESYIICCSRCGRAITGEHGYSTITLDLQEYVKSSWLGAAFLSPIVNIFFCDPTCLKTRFGEFVALESQGITLTFHFESKLSRASPAPQQRELLPLLQ